MARKRSQSSEPLADWRSISDDREKYQAYLCSREWAERREAVRKRAGDKCERCNVLPMTAVHHLTYVRKYDEPIEDLQAICRQCHEFTHGKSGFDPLEWRSLLSWLSSNDKPPMPMELLLGLSDESSLSTELEECVRGIRMLLAAGFEFAAGTIEDSLPFRLFGQWKYGGVPFKPNEVATCYAITGHTEEPDSWFYCGD